MPMFCSTVSVALDLHDQRVDDCCMAFRRRLMNSMMDRSKVNKLVEPTR